jgi:DNA-directed RNA polymerase specialized sigma24 family protein
MSLQAFALDPRLDALQPKPVDGLIANYFDRAFLVFNLFIDDPRACLAQSEAVFRVLDGRLAATEQDFYAELLNRVRDLPERHECFPGLEPDSVLCWLLKDSTGMSYAEIARVMRMERNEVARHIADVRLALLG